ncbi:MAG TPA: hypothetical protein PLS08_13150 [Chryseolinea sp.]|nr:hypothetical protein [Chryseolinea sp.]
MKKLILVVLLGPVGCSAFCQGSWNIGYIEVDSITSANIGALVKIDFKHFGNKTNSKSKHIRHYITHQDSAIVLCDYKEIRVVERRTIYVDHGSFSDQYLEILDENNRMVKRIHDSRLIEIEENRLRFLIIIDTYENHNSARDAKIDSNVKKVWIDKINLDGLMIEN